MPITYEPIATQTLGSAAASITFSSIPGTYTDLRLVFVGTLSSGNATTGWRANSDSATNYSETYIGGDGTSAFSGRNTNSTFGFAGVTDTNQSMTTVDVFSYAGSTYKLFLKPTKVFSNRYLIDLLVEVLVIFSHIQNLIHYFFM